MNKRLASLTAVMLATIAMTIDLGVAPVLVTLVNLGLLGLVVLTVVRRGRVALHAQGRAISGVCVGLAAHTGRSVWRYRLGFALALALGAHAVLAYLTLAIVLPWAPGERARVWSARAWRALRGRIAAAA